MANHIVPQGDIKAANDLGEKQYHDQFVHEPLADHEVSFAEYMYYAKDQREKEALMPA